VAKLLGLDLGTSSLKAIVIDEFGQVEWMRSVPYASTSARPGWSEQDPEHWIAAWEQIASEAPRVDTAGLTGQMHGLVALQKGGLPVRSAMLWNDLRAHEECNAIENLVGRDSLLAIVRNPITPSFQLPKLLWLQKHEPEHFSKIAHVLLPKDYLRFRMCGTLATDCSDASGTGCFDVAGRAWSEPVIHACRLQRELFPAVHESPQVVSDWQIGMERIPVVAGAGDQAASAIGTGAVQPGTVSISLGTSGVVFESLSELGPLPSEGVNVFCDAAGGWHKMGVTLACGGSLEWARATFFPDAEWEQLETLCNKEKPGANGVTFLPYLSGERCPQPIHFPCGTFSGLSAATTRATLLRSVFEGTAFSIREAFAAVVPNEGSITRVVLSGGGARSPLWRQILADVLKLPLVILQHDEGPSFGAALLAGVGLGLWNDVAAACDATLRVREMVAPSTVDYTSAFRRYQRLSQNIRRESAK